MKNIGLLFAVLGSGVTISFLVMVNLVTNSTYLWFIYPVPLLLMLPIGLYSFFEQKHTLFSLIGSIVFLIQLVTINLIHTPSYPWFLYALGPIMMWPILSVLGKRNKNVFVASSMSMLFILYYVVLNFYISPGYLWCIFPAFAILWWPLSLYHVKKKSYFAFSVNATILMSVFFICINVLFSPNTIWAVYPIFAVLWWPLSMYFYYYKRKLNY
ncbi:hypothetical protein GGQ92_003097 [Gracilibacillus halotolerans]|uniref:Uncharacterized protein n=1 Tax=Gracilibacillus halotolerans TaxID=74386 RepID=A0A841RTL8_9BACI|nr:hypothetical protein [Gracilibacillus halotolerans]MBB6514274.1 hypothetical protein [Gracilibacillus halotolerans]